jgi:hypothetical protein
MECEESADGRAEVQGSGRRIYGTEEGRSEKPDKMDEGRVGNKVREAFYAGSEGNRGEVPSEESEGGIVLERICSDNAGEAGRHEGREAICSAAQEDREEDCEAPMKQKVSETIVVLVVFIILGTLAVAFQNHIFEEKNNFEVCPLCGR